MSKRIHVDVRQIQITCPNCNRTDTLDNMIRGETMGGCETCEYASWVFECPKWNGGCGAYGEA